ncbi:MAG TPA: trypsin-like peptidase domain-containing protein [Pyrinomonadaceae bacterium]
MYILGEATSSGITLPQIPVVPRPTLPSSRVTNALALPYRNICRIVVRNYDNDQMSIGTGVLVSPYHVLTCGHVIYPPATPRTSGIEVFPGQNGPDEDVPRFRSNGWAISTFWRANDCRTAGEDYGVIRLAAPTRYGFMPLRPVDPAILTSIAVQLAGYPADREERSRHMYESQGQVNGAVDIQHCVNGVPKVIPRPISATARTIVHTLDTTKAQSGSPLWIDDGTSEKTLIGVHVGLGNQDGKLAVFLNPTVQTQIQHWMRSALPPINS